MSKLERLITENDIFTNGSWLRIDPNNEISRVDPLSLYSNTSTTYGKDYLINRDDLKLIVNYQLQQTFWNEVMPHFSNFDCYLYILLGDPSDKVDSEEVYWYCLYEFQQISDMYFDYADHLDLYHRFWQHITSDFEEIYNKECPVAVKNNITFEEYIKPGAKEENTVEKFRSRLKEIKADYDSKK